MQKLAFDERITHQDYGFYDLKVKRCNWLYFKFLILWTMWPYLGRIHLQRLFSLEYGVVLDSNLVSRMMNFLGLHLAPKKRIRAFSIEFQEDLKITGSTDLFLKPIAEENLPEFRRIDEQSKQALLSTIKGVCSGNTLSEIQDAKPKFKPFRKLKEFGSQLPKWIVRSTMKIDAIGIALDEKVIKKAFDLDRHPDLSSHYVSRVKTYLPSLVVEVAALIRPERIAEVVGHYFPYPQREYDHKNRRKSKKKHIYLKGFLESLFEKYGHLIMLADANYCTKELVKWFMMKKWDFIMRINPQQKNLLRSIQEEFDKDLMRSSVIRWIYSEDFGGWIRVLAYRKVWRDAKNQRKEKRYFLMTTLEDPPREVWRFYRKRWTLENTFKCLPVLDKTPGLNPDLIAGYFALVFHVLAPFCYQSRSSSRTLAKMLEIPMKIKKRKVIWTNLSSSQTRRLLLIAYQRSTETTEIRVTI